MALDGQRVKSIFLEAAGRAVGERAAFLDGACAGDAELRRRLEQLLAAHDRPDSLPAAAPAPRCTQDSSPEGGRAPAGVGEGLGAVIGPYKLLQQLGEGGMGTVYLAEQGWPVRRLVALKIIKPGMDSRQVLARFEAERQALALMDHPSIARVLDGGTTESGRPFFVMGLVKGVPITRYCDEHRLTPRQRLELFLPVCHAVQHAHQKGIIHRDIKPSNVMVCLYDGRPVPKVIDFGIARAAGQQPTERTPFTEVGQVVGTLEYMSPEQAELNQLDIDTRSDIYSLGVLLYELLTGSTPLERGRLSGTGLLEVLRLIREEEPPRPSTRLSESKDTLPAVSAQRQTEPAQLARLVRGELDWIVMKALEKDRNRRYESASAFAMDIRRYLADEQVLACPPSAAYRLRKFVRRHRAGLVTTTALLLVLLPAGGGVGWVLWERVAQQAARQVTTERTVTAALARAAQLAEQAEKVPGTTGADAGAALVLWRQAEDALGQAEAALTTGAEDDRLRQQVAGLQARLGQGRRQAERGRARALRREKLFRDLDEARLARAAWVDGDWDYATSSAKYAAAFAAYGLDVTPRRKDELARRIATEEPKVRDALIEALADWALAAEHPRTRWTEADLLALAMAADDNAWRKRFLTAILAHDKPTLRRLSALARQFSVAPFSLFELGVTLFVAGEHQEGLALLRWGRGRHPRDFWLHFGLGNLLCLGNQTTRTALELEEAIGCYRAALALRPEAGIVHTHLGIALYDKGQLDEAVAELREGVRLLPDDAVTHFNLGLALYHKGQVDEAIAAYCDAIRLKKDFAEAYCNLGYSLWTTRQFDEAIAACQGAIRLKKDFTEAHNNLGLALQGKGRFDQAIQEYHQAIRLKKDNPEAYNNLGNALTARGRLDEAAAAYRKAIHLNKNLPFPHHGLGIVLLREAVRLKQDFAEAHSNFGIALAEKDQLDEAIAEFREAILLKKDFAAAHYNLGIALWNKGRLDDAVAPFREAVRINQDYAEAHGNLGSLLQQQGQFHEALGELRRSHELGSRDPQWPSGLSAQKVRECERLVELDRKLAAFRRGKFTPASPRERLELAGLCSLKRLHRAAARFCEEAFAKQPELANDLTLAYRYNAACAAALAGCGQGRDAEKLGDAERARLRRQAREWLRADLESWARLLDREPDKARPVLVGQLRNWLTDDEFAGVRGPQALAKLPQAERQPWEKLWADVANLLGKAQSKTTPAKKSAAK
jgi:serine/threonine protein kinase/tetratricopeptide (TPR) repeat protein